MKAGSWGWGVGVGGTEKWDSTVGFPCGHLMGLGTPCDPRHFLILKPTRLIGDCVPPPLWFGALFKCGGRQHP